MSKKRILLGILIVMLMAVCSAFIGNLPSVFALETTNYETIENEAGTFYGQGYYVVGDLAILRAEMNPGYQFDAWVLVDDDGNIIKELSTKLEYPYTVESNASIKATWHKIPYAVNFEESLLQTGTSELNDFEYTITNTTQQDGANYYDDVVQITVALRDNQLSTNEELYVYDLTSENIRINNTSLANYIRNNDQITINTTYNNSQSTGFESFVITLNIREDITIGIDYKYMYKLEVVSGNSVDRAEIMQFITATNYYSQLDDYNYLVRADKQVTITVAEGDDIYQFVRHQFQGEDYSNAHSKAYQLVEHSIFTIEYNKCQYTISFNSYISNIYGKYDEMTNPLYNIADINLTAGDNINFVYDSDSKIITITALENQINYDYPTDIFGYKFVGFAMDDTLLVDNTYTMSATAPANAEIQLIFEYITYEFNIELVNDYFAQGVTYSYTYINNAMQLVRDTEIEAIANTDRYQIIGWSWNSNPSVESDYLDMADDGTVRFALPLNDDTTQVYTLYLDVDYKYLSVEYSLRDNSIEQNMTYDVVSVDLSNNQITFSDSENQASSITITYLSADITTDAGVITINTTQFGTVTISGDVLAYSVNDKTYNSIKLTEENGVTTYAFNKYTYFGEISAGVVEYLTLIQVDTNVTLTLNGRSSVDKLNQTELQSITTTIEFDSIKNAYRIIDDYYDIYLYKTTEDQYDYIVLNNSKYYYDGEKFILDTANVDTLQNVDITASASSIQISNLVPNSLVIYLTKPTDTTNYGFTGFTDKSGSDLYRTEYNNHYICVLNAESYPIVQVEYRKLENNITLRILNENAYNYENVTFTVDSREGSGKTVSATDGQEIIITVDSNFVTRGYKFDGYQFNGVWLTTNYALPIIMDPKVYANKIIDICFSEVEYILNINYIDENTDIINQELANGALKLEGIDEALTTLIVTLSGTYTFNAVANSGYYASKAYIGTEAYVITSLISNNGSTSNITKWKLDNTNFTQIIMDNADSDNEVNLYIAFATHTYSVKVYFEIAENASSITYPSLYINNMEATKSADSTITKYCVEASGFAYGATLEFKVDNFMLGTSLQKWKDEYNNQLGGGNTYTLNQINQNTTLTVVLQYVAYGLEFVTLDEQGEQCNYGSATANRTSYKLFDSVSYSINYTLGYVLKDKYYYDSTSTVTRENVDTGFLFNPANFIIEDGYKFKIYLVFGLKSIELSISNTTDGNLYYFKGQDVNSLVIYTVSRQRGNTITDLDETTGYQFQTGDILTMEIKPQSIGVDLYLVKLGNVSITTFTSEPYQLIPVNIYEGEEVVGMYYKLTIEFTASAIDGLEDNVELQNVIRVKTYNIIYTYNFINFKFGITLIRKYNNATAYGDEDVQMTVNSVGYGGVVDFSYVYEGMTTGISNKFRVDGFTIDGIKQEATSSFRLENIELWEQVALNKYIQNSNEITVVLVLNPKITLGNYSNYSLEDGYVYERSYIGENQGLVSTGENPDVIVGENFEVVIKYNSGAGFSDVKPINVGEYQVQIIAKISADNTQPIDVEFDEQVVFKITPAHMILTLKTYNATNPITKTYDGTSNLASSVLVEDILLDGIYERDKNQIYIDSTRLNAKFSGSLVNTNATLYDVNVFDIYMLDSSNNTVSNYMLASGQNLVFTGIGRITPKDLKIVGFKVSNKVYDGTNSVEVDLNGISYVGKLETDSTQILTENLHFYLDEFSVGVARQVKLDWTNALVGADSTNYSITYETKYIDIHPYEISYNLAEYGVFKIVDVDKKCLIPIGSDMIARVFDRGSVEYRSIYTRVEPEIGQGEKLKTCYEIVLRVGLVNQIVPEGLYVYLPKVSKVTKVVQVASENETSSVEFLPQDDYTVVKVERGETVFGVITRTTYMPLWLIILIICLILLLIIIIIIIFIVARRKSKNKYSSYDRI